MTDYLDSATDDLKRDEGYRQNVYECPAGYLTVGYGRNLESRGLTEKEASYLLLNDVRLSETELSRNFRWYDTAPDQVKRGLINMHMNIGLSRLSGFKNMLESLEVGAYETAADDALDSLWARQVGNRAKRIADMFRGAI